MLGPAGCACWLLWAHLSVRTVLSRAVLACSACLGGVSLAGRSGWTASGWLTCADCSGGRVGLQLGSGWHRVWTSRNFIRACQLRARWLCLRMQLLLPLLLLLPVTSPLNGTSIVRTWCRWQSWSAIGLWTAKGSDCQSCDGIKAPCGGRPRSVWNPPHGPVPPRACSIQAYLGSKARAGSSFSYGGVRHRTSKIVDLIDVFNRNPNFTVPPEGLAPSRRRAGVEFTVGRSAGRVLVGCLG